MIFEKWGLDSKIFKSLSIPDIPATSFHIHMSRSVMTSIRKIDFHSFPLNMPAMPPGKESNPTKRNRQAQPGNPAASNPFRILAKSSSVGYLGYA